MQDVIATLRILGIKAGADAGDGWALRPVLARREHERRSLGVGAAQRLSRLRGRVALGGRHAEPLEHPPVVGGWMERQAQDAEPAQDPAARHPSEGPRRARPDARQAAGVPHAGSAASRRPARVSRACGRATPSVLRPRRSDGVCRTWWRSSSTRPITGSGDHDVHDQAPTDARCATDLEALRLPASAADLASELPQGDRAGESRGGHRRRGHVHAHGLRRDAVYGRRPGGAVAARRLRRAECDRAGLRRRLRRLRDPASEHQASLPDS